MNEESTPAVSDFEAEADLRDALAETPGACSGDHPDPVLVAEYLDGVLDDAEREDLEAHLAGCGSCRRIMTEARRALGEASPETSPAPVPARGWPRWAVAAGLVLALAGAGWLVLAPRQAARERRCAAAGL